MLAHLPTLLLVIGYCIYWLELFFVNTSSGHTSICAWIVFSFILFFVIYHARRKMIIHFFEWRDFFYAQRKVEKALILMGVCFCVFIFIVVIKALLLPPHMPQEFDTINYHMTLPRQHLILNSFEHIRWSSADFFHLPLDFALAPYWFSTELPNKFPHLLFLFGLCAVTFRLSRKLFSDSLKPSVMILFALMGSHGLGIQMGIAMFDMINCYLLVAALEAFLGGYIVLAAIELAFLFWAKAFMPLQMICVGGGVFIAWWVLKRIYIKSTSLTFTMPVDMNVSKKSILTLIAVFLMASLCLALPFMMKSIKYSGTPLFPFAVGLFEVDADLYQPQEWEAIVSSSQQYLQVKDSYGHGRGVSAFIRHLWLIAVPEKGVNNSFDYPLGLPYLLVIVPFFVLFFQSLRKRNFALIPFFIVLFWLSWWFGSQQTRFLYIPYVLMLIVVIGEFANKSKLLLACLICALFFNALSIYRAHKKDFGKSRFEVLRAKDKQLIKLSGEVNRHQLTELNFFDAAFADFPIDVTGVQSAFVIDSQKE